MAATTEPVSEQKVRQNLAEKTRKKDESTSNKVIVNVDDLTFKKAKCKKGDEIEVTDIEKKYLLSTTPPSIKESK